MSAKKISISMNKVAIEKGAHIKRKRSTFFMFIFLSGIFSMGRIHGISQEWFKDTTSDEAIMRDLKYKKYSPAVLNSFDPFGKTGLMRAVGRVNLDLVKAFLAAGADVNISAADGVGDTALHIACYSGSFYGYLPIIHFLINYISPLTGTLVTNVNIRNKRGETPLLQATQISSLADRKKVMEWLVERGADINAQDNNGTTVLHIAVNNKDDYGVQMLFDTFGTLLNTHIVNKKEHKTPFEYALYLGFRDVAARIERCIDDLVKHPHRFEKKIKTKAFIKAESERREENKRIQQAIAPSSAAEKQLEKQVFDESEDATAKERYALTESGG